MMKHRATEMINVDAIRIDPRHRQIKEDAVVSLAASIEKVGLRAPITIRQDEDENLVLVTGAHRLEAVQRLGWDEIECFVVEDEDEGTGRMWEIAENLHRAELTALERDEHVAEWVRLSDLQSLQNATNESKRTDGRGHRKESGVRAASRELGIESTDAHRAVKVASISDEAKEVARQVGLDDNRSALLDAARAETADEQIASLTARAARKSEAKLAADPLDDTLASERQVSRLMDAWNAAGPDARQEFLLRIGAAA